MTYDTFLFCNELDLLEIRLNILDKYVDKFVLVESNFSHTHLFKPLYFSENKQRYDKFLDRIIHIITDINISENPFVYQWAHRDIILKKIPNLKYDDIVLHSDLDEIPYPKKLSEIIKNLDCLKFFSHDYYHYCLDLMIPQRNTWQRGMMVTKLKYLTSNLSQTRENWNRGYEIISDNGWHYGFLGPPKIICEKMFFQAHSNELSDFKNNEEYILDYIRNKSAFGGKIVPNFLQKVELNKNNCSEYILNNKEKYKYLFYDFYKN